MRNTIIILLLLLGVRVSAQDSADSTRRNSAAIEFGVNQLKEENLHPKAHTGTITRLSLNHLLRSRRIAEWGINLSYSRLRTAYEDLSATANVQIGAHYDYLFRVYSRNRLSYAVGPEVRLGYSACLYPNWDESHLYWANHLSLGVGNRLRYQLSGKKSLVVKAFFSVASAISRPEEDRPYKRDDFSFDGYLKSLHSNIELSAASKTFIADCGIEYRVDLGSHLSEAIFYSYRYSGIEGSRSSLYQNSIHQVGFNIYF
jgi:hypothetical protein